MQGLFQISRINTALGIGSYENLSFICTSCRWRHWSLTVRVSRFYYLHPIKVPQCLNQPWASKEYQPLSTNTEHILTMVYLVVDPDSQNQEYMLQRFKPLSHHIHWECRTCSRHHQSYASFQYHIHNTLIHHYFPRNPQEFFVKILRPAQPGSERYGANLTGQI